MVNRYLYDVAFDIFIDFYNLVLRRGAIKGNFIDKQATIDELVNTDKSIIRWGDGESSIYYGYDISFQISSIELRYKFRNILKSYIKNELNNCIFCMTHERFADSIREMNRKNKIRYQVWKKSRFLYDVKNIKEKCYSAYAFKGLDLKQYNLIICKMLSHDSLVIISSINSKIRSYFSYYKYNNKIQFIEIPPCNSFSIYDSILNKAIMLTEDKSKNHLVIIAGGPMAKCLTFDLNANGIKCYDVGKFFATECNRYVSL